MVKRLLFMGAGAGASEKKTRSRAKTDRLRNTGCGIPSTFLFNISKDSDSQDLKATWFLILMAAPPRSIQDGAEAPTTPARAAAGVDQADRTTGAAVVVVAAAAVANRATGAITAAISSSGAVGAAAAPMTGVIMDPATTGATTACRPTATTGPPTTAATTQDGIRTRGCLEGISRCFLPLPSCVIEWLTFVASLWTVVSCKHLFFWNKFFKQRTMIFFIKIYSVKGKLF